ncbi:MAG TPA: hypothetical protein VK327_03085 [Candidatus Paceibacterota bacterium]|nr:hypothetical protein [Candidatus Paceibacterota bacterium]
MAAIWMLAANASAALNTADPISFFTNVASRLLESELNLDLNRIQLYPTNQYTPAVHRLLQVTANLYDSTTNRTETDYPHLPTVFRPLLRRDADGSILIVGYREVTNADIAVPGLAPAMVDLADEASRTNIPLLEVPSASDDRMEPLVYNVPLIIGVKKGYPQFNRFALENGITAWRTLSFHRQPGQPISQTNQSYSLSISNRFAVQLWNSYQADFPRALKIVVSADVGLSLSNGLGLIALDGTPVSNRLSMLMITNIPAGNWKGFAPISPFSSFIPMASARVFLPGVKYVQPSPSGGGYFTTNWTADPANLFRVPHWFLQTDSRLQVALIDVSVTPNRLVDFVNLSASHPGLDVLTAIRGPYASCDGVDISDGGDFWCTNRVDNPRELPVVDNPALPTYGILNQIRASLGDPAVSDSMWRMYSASSGAWIAATEVFVERFYDNSGTVVGNLDFAAPFIPKRTIYQYVRWDANDPLVHRMIADLKDSLVGSRLLDLDSNFESPVALLLGRVPLSSRYLPWGENPSGSLDTNPKTRLNPAIKDPSLLNSDGWSFPSGEPLTFGTLGRIHRGTPWQTIYLKSLDTDKLTWSKWTGVTNPNDAWLSRPLTDWHLVSLLDSLFNDDPRPRLSINESATNLWLNTLAGIEVVTNSGASSVVAPDSPGASAVVSAIAQARAAQPAGHFANLGDILAVPELSYASPWLNTNTLSSFFAPPDSILEKIPSQLLSRLRVDSVAGISPINKGLLLRFSGYDGYPYSVETSSDLLNWIPVSTNVPADGSFLFYSDTDTAEPQFFRSAVLP